MGPSIMPGGSAAAWETIQPIFQKIWAHTDDGDPCCDWVGPDGKVRKHWARIAKAADHPAKVLEAVQAAAAASE